MKQSRSKVRKCRQRMATYSTTDRARLDVILGRFMRPLESQQG